MDFNSMKDQLAGKAKDELLGKVDEVKQDIAKRFSGGSGGTTEAANLTGPNQTEAGTDVTGARAAASAEAVPVEQATEAVGAGDDVDPTPDTDKSDEEAA